MREREKQRLKNILSRQFKGQEFSHFLQHNGLFNIALPRKYALKNDDSDRKYAFCKEYDNRIKWLENIKMCFDELLTRVYHPSKINS